MTETAEDASFSGPYIPDELLIKWEPFPLNPDHAVSLDKWRSSGIPVNLPANLDGLMKALGFALFYDDLPDIKIETIESAAGDFVFSYNDGWLLQIRPSWLVASKLHDVVALLVAILSKSKAGVDYPDAAHEYWLQKETPQSALFMSVWKKEATVRGVCDLKRVALAPYTSQEAPCPIDRVCDDLFGVPSLEGRDDSHNCKKNGAKLHSAAFRAYLDRSAGITDKADVPRDLDPIDRKIYEQMTEGYAKASSRRQREALGLPPLPEN